MNNEARRLAETMFIMMSEGGMWCESCQCKHYLSGVRFEQGDEEGVFKVICGKSGVQIGEIGISFPE